MLKSIHKRTKLIKNLLLLVTLVSVVTGVLLVNPKTSYAATFYQSDKTGNCEAGDTKIDSPPYIDPSSGTSYYCANGLTLSEASLATKNAQGKLTCPAGIAGFHSSAIVTGYFCLTSLQNPQVLDPIKTGDAVGGYTCGSPSNEVHIAIDLGCKHQGNPILDALFAIIRFLSIGVGLVIIASIIVAGIQYTVSRGDPQATASALNRIRETGIALAIFIFAYAIINWLVPAGLLK